MMRLMNDPPTAHATTFTLTACFHADAVAVFSLKQTDSHPVMRDSVRGPYSCHTECYFFLFVFFTRQGFPSAQKGCQRMIPFLKQPDVTERRFFENAGYCDILHLMKGTENVCLTWSGRCRNINMSAVSHCLHQQNVFHCIPVGWDLRVCSF